MAIVSVKEIHDGRSGEQSGDKGAYRYTRVFRITTNSAADGEAAVLAYLPAIGALHPVNVNAWCRSRRVNQDSKSKLVWNGTAEYSTEFELNENPLLDPTTFEWSTEGRTQTFNYDKNGNAILNSAGEPFITGIQDEVSFWTITATKNLAAVPQGILSYTDAVNSDNIIVDGVPFAPDTLRISKISISKVQVRNDVSYRELSIVLKCSDTWKRKIIQQGLNQMVGGNLEPCYEDTAKTIKARKPMPLAADGSQLAVPLAGPGSIVWKTVEIRPTMAFMNLPIDLSSYLSP